MSFAERSQPGSCRSSLPGTFVLLQCKIRIGFTSGSQVLGRCGAGRLELLTVFSCQAKRGPCPLLPAGPARCLALPGCFSALPMAGGGSMAPEASCLSLLGWQPGPTSQDAASPARRDAAVCSASFVCFSSPCVSHSRFGSCWLCPILGSGLLSTGLAACQWLGPLSPSCHTQPGRSPDVN